MLPEEIIAQSKLKSIDNLKNSLCFTDITSNDYKYYFVNKETYRVVTLCGSKNKILDCHNRDRDIDNLLNNPTGATIVKNPNKKERISIGDDGYTTINLYNSPFQYFKKQEVKEIPLIYDRFFSHLLPIVEQKEYFLDWFANSLFRRNMTYAVFVGMGGIGKGVCSEIIKSCHLLENYGVINDDSFKKEFNSDLEGKTFVLFDEAKIENQQDANKLKSYVNKHLRIERKGKDAITSEVYFSIMIHSNYDNFINITEDERRLSIFDLTDKKLLDVFTATEIDEMLKESNVELLFNYLISREIKSNLLERIVGDKAKEILNACATEWERVAFEFIEKINKRVSCNEVKKYLITEYDGKTPSAVTIFDRFKNKYQKSIKTTIIKGEKYLEIIK